MSRLEKLIQKLCPDGVEYRPLSTVAHYAKKRVDASEINEDTYIGVENLLQNKQGKIAALSVPKTGTVVAFEKGDILIGNIRPYLRKIWLADCYGGTNGDVLAIQIEDKIPLAPKFLYYVLSSEDFFLYDIQNSKGAKMPRGSKEAVMNYSVPVPPLPVQSEIICILDNFTELTAELTEQLTIELTARKNQYEFYRDKLLTFDVDNKNCEWRTLGEVSTYRRGSFPQPYGNKEWYDGVGAMPFVQVADIGDDMRLVRDTKRKISVVAQPKSVFAPQNSIIVSLQGSIGKIAITQYDAYIDRTVAIFQDIADVLLPKYFAYQLQRIFSIKEKTARGSTIKTITKEEFTTFSIPVPSLTTQQRIVNILDRFDALCNNLTSGLPAEIEARRKQYEYYRDKLLTFKEKRP